MGDIINLKNKKTNKSPPYPELTFWSISHNVVGDEIEVGFEFSHPEFLQTKLGRRIESQKLMTIILYLSESDPSIGAELLEMMENYFEK